MPSSPSVSKSLAKPGNVPLEPQRDIAGLLAVPSEDEAKDLLEGFPANQRRALLALAGGVRVGKAAALVGVDRKTIQRWLKKPQFEAARREVGRWLIAKQLNLIVNARTELAPMSVVTGVTDKKAGTGRSNYGTTSPPGTSSAMRHTRAR